MIVIVIVTVGWGCVVQLKPVSPPDTRKINSPGPENRAVDLFPVRGHKTPSRWDRGLSASAGRDLDMGGVRFVTSRGLSRRPKIPRVRLLFAEYCSPVVVVVVTAVVVAVKFHAGCFDGIHE